MFELIGCPMHFGVSDKGLSQGIAVMNARFPDLKIRELPEVELPEEGLWNLKHLNSTAATCQNIALEVCRILQRGNRPLFIGGDHASAMGSVSGSAALNRGMGLLWIDAHADINTDVTTLTGNIHGMPVSALMGYGCEKLCAIFTDAAPPAGCTLSLPPAELPKILPRHVVLYGIRDVDPLEAEIIERLGVRCFSFEEIRRRGQRSCLEEAADYLADCPVLHVSFDLDSMDPAYIKGVTVPVAGGFTEEDVFYQFAWLQGHCRLASVDVVEYNPLYDTDGVTGDFLYRLIEKIR